LIKFTDTDGDGVADQREVLLSGWVLNINANSLIGPFMAPDGWMYMTSAIEGFDVTTQEGERLTGETARIWRMLPDASRLEWISAGGMNNPVELTFTEASEPIGTETYFTNPHAGQRDALVYWTEGGVYPKPNRNIDRDQLPRTGDLMPVVTKYSRVAPSGIGRYRGTTLGEDFTNNLFSAQFNTHRILRHKLYRDGASFRTEDEVFFATDNEDFHPTDVLEDGDGSLLVVETGGWFIKGCPLSQVSKPELEGAIYRVRWADASAVEDPFGNQIDWSALEAEEALAYLSDARPFVRDRAIQQLVDLGETAVPHLTETLANAKNVDIRTRAVFILYRIGSSQALSGVRTALNDSEVQVAVAAARSLGLAKDVASISTLIDLLDGEEAIKRQAATALGQIGSPAAVPALLSAAEGVTDRFVEHAIIYALISLNEPELLAQALSHTSSEVRRTALIALDQIPDSPLHASQLTDFLTSGNPDLQNTALWVAAHHPEWAGDMTAYLGNRFSGEPLSEEEKKLYGDLLVSFCGDTDMQAFIANQLKQTSTEQQLFLLDAISACGIEELPHGWISALENQLLSGNSALQTKALDIVQLREVSTLASALQQVADNPQNTGQLRIEALAALIRTDSVLSNPHFQYLYHQLAPDNAAPLRQQAATTLAQANITESQLLTLTKEYLPRADAFILPRLLPVFQGSQTSEVGTALATTLKDSPSLDGFSEENIRMTFASYPEEVQPEVNALLTKLQAVQAERLQRLNELEEVISQGDIERGRSLYFGKAICSTCHTLGPEGGNLGPDLTSIQRDRSAHDLLEAVLYPSVSFVREYETYKISTPSQEYVGIIQEQSLDAIVLGTSPQTSVRIPTNEITSTEILDVSMMPQGLDQLLTPQELADLMAFILGQDQDPETDAAILR
jgi:putative heme-binding domain-containing protein